MRDREQARLLERAVAGHEPSFLALYSMLYEPVLGYVSRRVNNETDAEDIVSGVFHRFLAHLKAFDAERGSVWTWAMTLARNAVVDHYRSRKLQDSIEGLQDILRSEENDPLARLIEIEEDRLLHGVLREEPPEVRELFALRFAEGMRYREIAKLLGLDESTVRQRFSRTMRRLKREQVSQENVGERRERTAVREHVRRYRFALAELSKKTMSRTVSLHRFHEEEIENAKKQRRSTQQIRLVGSRRTVRVTLRHRPRELRLASRLRTQ